MDERARRDLALLNSIEQDAQLTQRRLSDKLGIALGLTNIYLKRFVHKGYVKCTNVRPNRLLYLLTPKGIAEKTRLTYAFWEYSLHLYGEVRQHLREVLSQSVASGVQRIAIYGTGEAAELAYLSLKELGVEPVAILDSQGGGTFLGMPIRALQDGVQYDLMIVATLESPERVVAQLVSLGVVRNRLVTLRPTRLKAVSRAAELTGTER